MSRWVAGFLLLTAVSLAAQEAVPLRIPADEYARRRARLAERLPGGALVVDTAALVEIGEDHNTPLFDFKYLTGFHDDRGILALVDGKPTVFASRPEAKALRGLGFAVLPVGNFDAWAKAHLAGADRIHVTSYGKARERLRDALPRTKLSSNRIRGELIALRLIKSETEQRLVTRAADATNEAHLAAMKALRPGMNEAKLQEIIEQTFAREGCPEPGFRSICGSGRNGTILHYRKNNQTIDPDTLIVLDIGASTENYVADITRTLPTSGTFTPDQRKHYQLVLDAQKAAEGVLKPGVTFWDLERASRRVYVQRGMTKWSYAHSRDFHVRHGIGHFVGMSVHDSGDYDKPFQPGMIITIEPGWYDKDLGYGIRIEDLYLVTKDGFKRLSADVPREMDAIEKLMRGREF